MTLSNALTLEGDNLILYGLQTREIEPVITFLQDETRAAGFDHIPERGDAWRGFAAMVVQWHIHGYEYYTIKTKSGEIIGISGIWYPETWPEPEVGYVVFKGFEGQSIAHEAANHARRWAHEDIGVKTLTNDIALDNTRYQVLAERMGTFL